tara:strand:+ start:22 stop:288 length:267 start_codon:yes stop_codon:yes gene_type:complete
MMKMMLSIGDKVKFKNDLATLVIEAMVVVKKRKMFASDIHAYTVKCPNGEIAEYDETQLVKLNNQQCNNCHDVFLYPDEGCPDCGRHE